MFTENWLGENAYCPSCGCAHITKAANNRPVLDFDCPDCAEQFELKSKQAKSAGKIINDGAYSTMMQRIQAADNPNFFFLSYNKADYSVRQLMLVPKHFHAGHYNSPEKYIEKPPDLFDVRHQYRRVAKQRQNPAGGQRHRDAV